MYRRQYLFVYGTLLQDCNNEMSQFLQKHAEIVGHGYFCGKLYDVDEFPGAILSEDFSKKVYGNIYKLSNPELVFKVLDEYEGIGAEQTDLDLFKRVKVEAFTEAGHTLKTWVYIYNLPTNQLRLIPSGRYI
ncbi:gamma-glutamylcyclotransferase family protein [Aestuariibaculum sediminum]|uniref:Gamma-glutamylcyclotransferase n=1 Tax=Aestuariibaculum sediminum TaxID=2770637 RepID=A0A8J6QJ81_9FLAO|nr:gamma-glutamylcyclotransferase family protein [Aestuariibaculum sediminum]MBD0832764.1 gamma-glutamylcyclotransferase [Aestuariibaculum sediminum]